MSIFAIHTHSISLFLSLCRCTQILIILLYSSQTFNKDTETQFFLVSHQFKHNFPLCSTQTQFVPTLLNANTSCYAFPRCTHRRTISLYPYRAHAQYISKILHCRHIRIKTHISLLPDSISM
ncbi:hypothetical protein FKM82_002194 [Ascaphus truei]